MTRKQNRRVIGTMTCKDCRKYKYCLERRGICKDFHERGHPERNKLVEKGRGHGNAHQEHYCNKW